MTTVVVAPLAGTVLSLAQVPDPVFAAELVGSGVAIEPPEQPGQVDVIAPVAGRILKLHPHAFVILRADGAGVLVHLGIDTVKLGGAGFTLHVEEGAAVDSGQAMVTFDPSEIRALGLSAACPVVVMDTSPHAIERAEGMVGAGEPLFDWEPASPRS